MERFIRRVERTLIIVLVLAGMYLGYGICHFQQKIKDSRPACHNTVDPGSDVVERPPIEDKVEDYHDLIQGK